MIEKMDSKDCTENAKSIYGAKGNCNLETLKLIIKKVSFNNKKATALDVLSTSLHLKICTLNKENIKKFRYLIEEEGIEPSENFSIAHYIHIMKLLKHWELNLKKLGRK